MNHIFIMFINALLMLSCNHKSSTVTNSEWDAVSECINQKDFCINTFHGDTICINLKGKPIYVYPTFQPIESVLTLLSNDNNFSDLKDNESIVRQADSLAGGEVPVEFLDNLNLNLIDTAENFAISIKLTAILSYGAYKYCVVQLRENTNEEWTILLKIKNGELLSTDVNVSSR